MTSTRTYLAAASICCITTVNLLAADTADQARALVQYALHREDVVLKGVKWQWLLEKGRCRTADDAVSGRFDKGQPVESYTCRWLSNDGVFLYEVIAQQNRRILESDAAQRIVVTTEGSSIFLCTKESRLHFDPAPFVSWHGDVENRMHGFTDGWGPGSIPVYGGGFGLGRASHLLEYIAAPENKVTVGEQTTGTGVKARVLRINMKDRTELAYFFDAHNLALLQSQHFHAGQLLSQIAILKTQSRVANGEEIELPTLAVSFYKEPGEEFWNVSRMTSQDLTLTPAALSEMVVHTKNAVFALNPMGRRQTADFVTDISPANLDSVVEGLFTKLQKEDASRKQASLPAPPTSQQARSRIAYLLLFNVALLAIAATAFLWKRFMRHR